MTGSDEVRTGALGLGLSGSGVMVLLAGRLRRRGGTRGAPSMRADDDR